MKDIETSVVKEGDTKTSTDEEDIGLPTLSKDSSVLLQEVQEIKEGVNGVINDSDLTHKVDALISNIEGISLEVQSWRTTRKDDYIETLENLKNQVSEIESEWDSVSVSMKNQREKLESLLESFPGIIETSTLRSLSLRVTHMEQLTSELLSESAAKSSAARGHKQLIISLTALGVTVILWVVWIALAVIS